MIATLLDVTPQQSTSDSHSNSGTLPVVTVNTRLASKSSLNTVHGKLGPDKDAPATPRKRIRRPKDIVAKIEKNQAGVDANENKLVELCASPHAFIKLCSPGECKRKNPKLCLTKGYCI